MPKTAVTNTLNWPRWAQLLLIALLVLLIGSRITSLVDSAAYRAGLYGELVSRGGSLINDPEAPDGFGKMIAVVPGGAFARAGIRNGDFVQSDPVHHFWYRSHVGDRLDFTLDRGGVRSEHHIIIEAVPAGNREAQSNSLRLVNLLAAIVSSLVGCFVLWRGWGNTTAMMLGVALVAVSRGGGSLPPWASELIVGIAMMGLMAPLFAAVALLMPFAMRLFEQQAGVLPRWHWRLAALWVGWCIVSMATNLSSRFWLTTSMTWTGGGGYGALIESISMLIAIAYLIAGWRKSAAAERSRLALIIFALTAYLFASAIIAWDTIQTNLPFVANTQSWPFYLNALMQGIVAPGLLAYAVLRHKLFDLGFAVNRTLVFGAIGVLLLASFALIEWAIKQAIPKVWYGGSVYISAGIAVSLYLLFTRIHHRVEHAIERLFFHKWQVNEAALKRFVAAAGHMEQPGALAGHFTTELARFTGGAAVALYARTAEGNYTSASGETVGADDLALAAMRAELGPIVPAEIGSPLDSALALPMMHQAALAGVVLLGPKPTGEDYRPDEVEVLGWATQQVGLDLQAIRVRELEQAVVKLEARNANLAEILAKALVTEG
jgi:hypothetical protein